jgi:Cellulose-binding Sde182, nucleoside hydrolase-like domain
MNSLGFAIFVALVIFVPERDAVGPSQARSAAERPRVVVTTDIGGTDQDDFQSMVHFLLYADMFDVEGIVSSPYGPGRREHILQVVDRYAADYPNLKRHSDRYPEPDALRRVARQGAIETSTGSGVRQRTDPDLWIIEANSTYRGWFTGGNQAGDWGNRAFVAAHVAGHGALGAFFATLVDGTIKMGDSPSVGYLLRNTLDDPSKPGWGGRFVRVWDGRKTVFTRLTTERDSAEAFGVVEFAIPVPAGMTPADSAQMVFDGRIPAPAARDGDVLRFRFSPRDAKVWPYVIRSTFAGLDGRSGRFTAVPAPPSRTAHPSTRHPHWWTDDPDPAAAEGVHAGARSVSRWREAFLRDFAARLQRTR